jgi:DNA-binding response OmpR family regulator
MDVHVRRLRKALSSVVEDSLDYAGLVQTVHGMGYRFSTRVK